MFNLSLERCRRIQEQNVSAVNMAQDKYREDGTISVAQRTQGTEAYRQIKEGEGNVGEMQNIADRQSYEDNVQMDTVIISEEGRQAYSRMSKQEGEGNEGQDTGSGSIFPEHIYSLVNGAAGNDSSMCF